MYDGFPPKDAGCWGARPLGLEQENLPLLSGWGAEVPRLAGHLRAIWSPRSGKGARVCTAGAWRRTCSDRRSKMTSKKEKKGRRKNSPSIVASAPRQGIFSFIQFPSALSSF